MNICLHCNHSTKNPKFCSRSCAAIHTNKSNPKRKRSRQCRQCGAPILSKAVWCKKCKPVRGWGELTLEEAIYTTHHKSSAFALVRSRARAIAKKYELTSCINCGYDKHVEIAHIKPISSFTKDTPVSVVNDKSNLLPLCPNCHWEFDHGLLEYPRQESNLQHSNYGLPV